MSHEYHIGMKVVCIIDAWGFNESSFSGQLKVPVKNAIYTIRDMLIATCCPIHADGLYLALHELDNRAIVGCCSQVPEHRQNPNREPMFLAIHFRPLTDAERKVETGMTMLRALQSDWSEPDGDRFDRPNYIPVGEPWPALTPDAPKRKPAKVVIFY